jgi:hypothetical protein
MWPLLFLNRLTTSEGASDFLCIDRGTPVWSTAAPQNGELIRVAYSNRVGSSLWLQSETARIHGCRFIPDETDVCRDTESSSAPAKKLSAIRTTPSDLMRSGRHAEEDDPVRCNLKMMMVTKEPTSP